MEMIVFQRMSRADAPICTAWLRFRAVACSLTIDGGSAQVKSIVRGWYPHTSHGEGAKGRAQTSYSVTLCLFTSSL